MGWGDPNIRVKVSGDKELRATMKKLSKSVQWKINRKAVQVCGKIIRESVIAHIPAAGIHKRTGNLLNSVKQATDGVGRSASVATTTIYTQKKGGFHAHLLEFGHRLMLWEKQPRFDGRFGKPPRFFNRIRRRGFVRARPFFAPAVEESMPRLVSTYATEMWAGISREV